ncbi:MULTISPECIES: ABC transporter ATP-binding protein [unclassified Achromobacter]|uniref:ABC transporter ATP-binding protein n=1 Tax=unclassified Achromobacter TaxID=2626865 RepID=UPI000B51E503|nr:MULTISPECIES: ABC transporter ATP-binding protein [unclassified Achromobacter]OWT76876.1 microcin ABC transporter ATP-binding protein [Achromobacter sp. HZ28]OWT77756.1 microcin ABC transporter ATP-binding protein [Achromobacter sp. HZ34]
MTSSPASSAAGAPVLQIQGLAVRLVDGPDDSTGSNADSNAAGAGPRRVVQDISFDIHAGETLCVVGESGSGKSVTSFAVMGLLAPDALRPCAGRILLDGEDILTCSPERLRELRATRMSMVFQEPMTALNPVRTVGWQIDEVLRAHSRLSAAERKKKILDMLQAVRLPDIERIYASYPHQLSGGQRQRIVICMALILNPKLLIADEPTTALDVTTQKQILTLIRDLQKSHDTAVLFITHDFGVVADIADRIAVMNRGRIVEVGTREQILAQPREAYTRMLVSSVPSLAPATRVAADGVPLLTVRGLNKTYTERGLFKARRSVNAVNDVSFTLHKKEILGIVGESGSGKSTVARCIARLIDPSSGSVRIGEQEIATASRREFRPLRQRIQVVFQDPYRSLNARMRVGDSITEGLRNFGKGRQEARQRATELLELVGLSGEAMARYPHQFSGGQRQRICIARALALSPDILIADEAVSALDVSVQAQVLDLIESIREQTGTAVLFITHDLRVAAQICNTIVVMKSGKIVEAASAHEVLSQPRDAYTRQLIDAAPGRHWDFQNFRPAA